MSAWTRSITGRAYHFEPLNAKKLERPAALNESDIVYTPPVSYTHLTLPTKRIV